MQDGDFQALTYILTVLKSHQFYLKLYGLYIYSLKTVT